MIIPNLMVRDLARSVAFYRDVIGLELQFVIGPDRRMQETPGGGSFASLAGAGGQLMLQTVESLAGELPVFAEGQVPAPGGTIYFRDVAPEPVLERLPEGALLKGPELTWYGMREAYVTDPDGHVICLGVPEGPPPG